MGDKDEKKFRRKAFDKYSPSRPEGNAEQDSEISPAIPRPQSCSWICERKVVPLMRSRGSESKTEPSVHDVLRRPPGIPLH